MNWSPGTRVTVTYRAEFNHVGTVLARNDPRAWTGSIAFSGRTPTQEEVDAHLAHPVVAAVFASEKDARVPIVWDFGNLYWEPASAVLSL